MNDKLRTLLTLMRNAQAMLDIRRSHAEVMKKAVGSTSDDIIAADIDYRKALTAFHAAENAYEDAIRKAAEAA